MSNLKGKRRTWTTDFETEQWSHLTTVIEHGTIDDTWRIISKELEVGEVGRDDAIDLLAVELAEDGLRDGSTYLRLCAATELIDQNEGRISRVAQEELHVLQMTRIGREVIVDTLLITDIHEDILVDGARGIILHRHGQAMLQHILHEAEGLQTHRLTTGIRT